MEPRINNWAGRSLSFKREYTEKLFDKVDADNMKIYEGVEKSDNHSIECMSRDAADRFVGKKVLLSNGVPKKWYIKLFEYLKKQYDIKKGTYSSKQKYMVDSKTGKGRWIYV